MAREEGWHHETFVPDPVYRVRDFFKFMGNYVQ